jgi:pre-mRNA-processing factor 19
MATLKGHTKKVTAVHFSTTLTSEGLPSHVISSSLDKSVRVFAPNGAKGVYGMAANLAIGSEVNALAMHPSSTLVASANADGSISIHDLLSEKPATILTIPLVADAAPGTSNTAIAFHPDGAMIGVGSSDSSIRIFQVLTGELAATFAGVEGGKAISSLTFSENGYILASSAVDSSIVSVWDLRKLTNVHQIDLPTANVINAVKFDPSAQYLVAVGTDVRVFMNKTWEELVVVEDNTAEITGVEWGVDSKEIAVSGMDRTIRIIGVPVAE